MKYTMTKYLFQQFIQFGKSNLYNVFFYNILKHEIHCVNWLPIRIITFILNDDLTDTF